MDDLHYAAVRRLAIRTARVVREPLHDLVGKPKTQRYFLKALRGRLGREVTDEDIREASLALVAHYGERVVRKLEERGGLNATLVEVP